MMHGPLSCHKGWLLIPLMMFLTIMVSPAASAQSTDPTSELDGAGRLVWDREWSLYAARYTQRDGEFYACAKYHPGFPSSLQLSPEGLMERFTRTRKLTFGGNMSREIRTRPNLADAQIAAAALPAVKFGEFGHIHSAEIVQVTGRQEMIIRRLWLVDEDALRDEINQAKTRAGERDNEVEARYQFREELAEHQRQESSFRTGGVLLIGFDTARLKPGQRYRGPNDQGLDIAITGKKTIQYTRAGSDRSRELEVTVALPASAFAGRITQEQFLQMLQTRNLTLAQFIQWTMEEKKNDAENALIEVIRRVEENKPAPQAEVEEEKPRESRSSRRSRRSRDREKDSQKNESAEQAPAESGGDDLD